LKSKCEMQVTTNWRASDIVLDGINMMASGKLQELRAFVNGLVTIPYKGSTDQLKVQPQYAALNPEETQEISGSRYWRDLVESIGFDDADTIEFKNDLHIPY
jgi:hypothetical protein